MASRNEEFDRLTAPDQTVDAGPSVGSMGSIEEVTWRNAICKSRHPAVAFFHVFFKGTALILYFTHKMLGFQYVTVFVLLVLLMAADFWTVKNVSGRLLVGLRWWNRIKADGTNEWIYESAPNAAQLPSLDRRIFWWPVYLTPVLWGTFALLAFVSFSWEYLPLHCVAAGLSGSNALGYMRCSSDASRRLQQAATAGLVSGLGYMPGALPALGTTMLAVLRSQTGPAPQAAGATAPQGAPMRLGSGAGAAPMAGGPGDFAGDPFGQGPAANRRGQQDDQVTI